jgi:hypothetical protein
MLIRSAVAAYGDQRLVRTRCDLTVRITRCSPPMSRVAKQTHRRPSCRLSSLQRNSALACQLRSMPTRSLWTNVLTPPTTANGRVELQTCGPLLPTAISSRLSTQIVADRSCGLLLLTAMPFARRDRADSLLTVSVALQTCEAFAANRYPLPEDSGRQRRMHSVSTHRELSSTIDAGELYTTVLRTSRTT